MVVQLSSKASVLKTQEEVFDALRLNHGEASQLFVDGAGEIDMQTWKSTIGALQLGFEEEVHSC